MEATQDDPQPGYLSDDILADQAGWYAWAAGIFDGESHIGHHQRQASIQVQQASDNGEPQMLTRLQALFGGTIVLRAPRRGHGELRPLYTWRLSHREVVKAALTAVWPWLGDVKREQANRAMDAYTGPEGRRERIRESARRRWADPEWRAAHPDAVANAKRFAALCPANNGRDPVTGRWVSRNAS